VVAGYCRQLIKNDTVVVAPIMLKNWQKKPAR
jgi:hypothetical protein